MLLSRCLKFKTSKYLTNSITLIIKHNFNKSNLLNSKAILTVLNKNLHSSKFYNEKSTTVSTKSKQIINKIEGSYLDEILRPEKNKEPKTTEEKVKQAAENTFFYSICVASLAATSIIIYYLFDYFWAPDSPQRIYSNALKLVRKDETCLTIFGSDILAHGEMSGRGRRRHIANRRYEVDGVSRVRVVFYIKGNNKTGKVTAELARNSGTWDYRFLLVETDGIFREPHFIIDNR